jgi:DNA repair exonuclease SbcCD ATPase subunit
MIIRIDEKDADRYSEPTQVQILLIKHLYSQAGVQFLDQQKPQTKAEAKLLITELERKNTEVEELEEEILELQKDMESRRALKDRIKELEDQIVDLQTEQVED